MKRNVLLVFLSIVLLLQPISIYAATKNVDSIGSDINDISDNIIGKDKTQVKETFYNEFESRDDDFNEPSKVYVTQASTFGIFIPKTIILSGEDGQGYYIVTISGDIGGTEIVKVTPQKSFTLSQYGKNDIVANVAQDKCFWKYNEFGIIGNGVVSAPLTAGSWDGNFNFNISLNSNIEIETTNLETNTILDSTASLLIASEVLENENNDTMDLFVNIKLNDETLDETVKNTDNKKYSLEKQK